MPQVSKLNPRITIWSRCREWRQTQLKSLYEASMLDEDDDEGMDRVARLADANMKDIEDALIEAAYGMTSIDDVQSILGIALALLKEGLTDRAKPLLHAIHRGCNGVRNAHHKEAEAA